MQVVIDIPDKDYKKIKWKSNGNRGLSETENLIANGIHLPKSHGRLIDADLLWDKLSTYTDNEGSKMPFGFDDSLIHRDSAMFIVEDSPTIIEADKEE